MKYTPTIGNKICQITATSSVSLMSICKQLNVPYATATNWIHDQQHELHHKYAQAHVMRLLFLGEEIRQIAEESAKGQIEVAKNGKIKVSKKETAARTRLRIQTRKAILTKLATVVHLKEAKKGDIVAILKPPYLSQN